MIVRRISKFKWLWEEYKKTWNTIKEVIDTTKSIDNSLPKMMVAHGRETFKIANGFPLIFHRY